MRTFILLCWILLPTLFTPAARAGIPLTLSDEQLFEYDETGWVTLTQDQRGIVSASKGFSPTRVRPVYDEPDGATSESGYNLALRTGDKTVDIYSEFLISDEEATARVALWKEKGGKKRNPLSYFSYLIDADGRIWKSVSQEEVGEELKRKRKNLGTIGIHTPTSLVDEDSVASRDTLRRIKRLLEELGTRGYEVTKRSR